MRTEDILKIAKAKGLNNKGFIEKDYYQDKILYSLFSRTNNIVFKGGTALYKLYNLPRFSEDLDFGIIGKVNLKRLIKSAARELKFSIKRTYFSKKSALFKLSFEGFLTGYNTIRIDFSKLKVYTYETVDYVPRYIDIPPFVLNVMSKKEMIAEKIHSIFHRTSARDLYDLFFLLRMEPADKRLILKKVPNFTLKKFKERIEKLKPLWDPELKPFVLERIPYETAKNFCISNIAVI